MIESDQEFNQQYFPPVKKTLIINKRSILIIFIITLIIIILLIFIILFLSSRKTSPVITQASPEPETYYPSPITTLKLPPSVLATDAAILKIKSEVNENISTANSLDLSEPNLSFPILDFNIGFE